MIVISHIPMYSILWDTTTCTIPSHPFGVLRKILFLEYFYWKQHSWFACHLLEILKWIFFLHACRSKLVVYHYCIQRFYLSRILPNLWHDMSRGLEHERWDWRAWLSPLLLCCTWNRRAMRCSWVPSRVHHSRSRRAWVWWILWLPAWNNWKYHEQ